MMLVIDDLAKGAGGGLIMEGVKYPRIPDRLRSVIHQYEGRGVSPDKIFVLPTLAV